LFYRMMQDNLDELFEIIGSYREADEKEKQKRRDNLKREYDITVKRGEITDGYFQLAHEIYSLLYLQQKGNVVMAKDSVNAAGSDFIWKQKYEIECVCPSMGDVKKSGLEKFLLRDRAKPSDYKAKKEIVNSRFTQALGEKKKFYVEHVKKRTIDETKPYLVFLGLGSLKREYLGGDNAIDFIDILFGKGMPQFTMDRRTREVVSTGYEHRKSIKKQNGAEIDCNLFLNEEYKCISGVLFTTAWLVEKYNEKNTYLFVNPYANNPINLKDFEGVPYWDLNTDASVFKYEFHSTEIKNC